MNLSSATWTGFLKILQEQIQLHKKLKADEKTDKKKQIAKATSPRPMKSQFFLLSDLMR